MSSRYYDKQKLKEQLTHEQIYELLDYFGGNPTYQSNCITSDTICHNMPNEGSHKLYYYFNSNLFRCFTHCEDAFDIFELVIKIKKLREEIEWQLYDAMDFIASFFGFEGVTPEENKEKLSNYWESFNRYNEINNTIIQPSILKEYATDILNKFSYLRIKRWEDEFILPEVTRENKIGYCAATEQITIPHYDINNRLIGIRGRYLIAEDAELYGKYRPLYINKTLYSHPLSLNLYNINNSKDNISKTRTAIIFESEKACLQYRSYFGKENDISVAICGSNLSVFQVKLLESLKTNEIIIALDRQFQEIGDEEFGLLKRKLLGIYNKYKSIMKVTFIFDKCMITPYKASPTDCGKEIFMKLLHERIVL